VVAALTFMVAAKLANVGVPLLLKQLIDAMTIPMGSTTALLVVPLLVLIGPVIGHPIDLHFELYELVAIITAVVVSNLVSLDGRSDWLEGVLLLAAYIILAAGFYFQPAILGSA
jgi:Ca2+:H+ antiporter